MIRSSGEDCCFLPLYPNKSIHLTETLIPGVSETKEKIFEKVDTKALRDVVYMLKELTGMMRDFYNIPTPAQAEAQRIAAERLELEKRRVDADTNEDREVGIVIMPEIVKEWSK